jgi:hypothetical protein
MYGSTYLTVKRGINLVIKFIHRSGCQALNGADPEKTSQFTHFSRNQFRFQMLSGGAVTAA